LHITNFRVFQFVYARHGRKLMGCYCHMVCEITIVQIKKDNEMIKKPDLQLKEVGFFMRFVGY